MKTKRLKKFVVPSIYAFSLIILTVFVIAAGKGVNNLMNKEDKKDSYVAPETTEVQAEETKIIKPYTSEKVKIGKSFYDYTGENTDQEKSIYYYENTYMQNSGVDYISTEKFDAVASLDGEVINIKKDNTLGNIVEVKHENDIITVYQGLDKVNVKKEQQIKQGEIIGTSSASKINPEYKNYIHFEVYYKGEIMDPEDFYKVNIDDLGKDKSTTSTDSNQSNIQQSTNSSSSQSSTSNNSSSQTKEQE